MAQEIIQGYRLSPQQKRLWLLGQSGEQPRSVSCVIEITGPLDEDALRRALDELVLRHEILRTSFQLLPGMTIPVQVISEQGSAALEKTELSSLSADEQAARIAELLEQPVKLSQLPLFRAQLVSISPQQHALLLSAPPLCLDRASLEQLFSEIAGGYARLKTGEEIVSPESMQYADVAEWQNELLESKDAGRAQQYWKQFQLESEQKLPFEKPGSQPGDVNQALVQLSEISLRRLHEISQRFETTLSTLLLACWQAIARRSTAWDEVTISVAFNGRNFPELQNAVGPIERYLPISVAHQEDQTFRQLLKSLEEQLVESAKLQQFFPLDRGTGILPVERQMGETSMEPHNGDTQVEQRLGETQVEQHNGEISVQRHMGETPLPLRLPFGFAWSDQPTDIDVAGSRFSFSRQAVADDGQFKLQLIAEQKANGSLAARLHYDSSLIQPEDVERLAERFETLIDDLIRADDIARGDGRFISELQVIGPGERSCLLGEFNETAKDFPVGRAVHELFTEQAQKTPQLTAVVFEGEQLTFAELNNRANHFAHRLRQAGVTADAAVGLCLERSLDLIAGMLGIMKAGGAYLPLDPGMPADRIKDMLSDAGARVLLTKSTLNGGTSVLPVGSHMGETPMPLRLSETATPPRLSDQLSRDEFEVICVDHLRSRDVIAEPVTNVTDRNLAYIIFTSGSTGRPKGVSVEHRQLANYVHAINDRLQLPAGSSFASVSTIAADLGNTVLFPPLLTGGTLHLISEERATNPDAFAEYFRRHQIDCLKIVPSHLSALLSAADPAEVLPRRCLVLGGEAGPPSLAHKVQSLAPDCRILNHYGPTETTVGATTFSVTANEATGTLPLGRPLANAQTFVLDKWMRPAPPGVPGELFIAGAGVARGYVARPDATAEKFVPNPFATNGGARLYRTGDLARYLSNGTLEFLGRSDDQVKIHGYRIEPGEIAAVLRAHDDVRDAVVIAREDQPGEKRLVAYVVASDESSANAAALKTFLQAKLPEYMIPRNLVFIESLPLTKNGKLDRKALPAPEAARANATGFVKPRNQVEETLAGIWSTILGIEAPGIHDNFFELGGDSILSIQIIARANQAGLKLSPRQVFQHQTIAGLAAVAGTAETVVVEQGMVTGAVPLSPVQTRFFAQQFPEPHHYNQAMLLNLEDAIDVAVLEQALAQLIIHHDVLRSRFIRSDEGWQQRIVAAEPVPVTEFELADLSAQAAAMHASLNLADGPLLRAGLFRSNDDTRGKLLLVIHHLVVDGVSWRVLLEDLNSLCAALMSGRQAELPAKTTSFKRWSELLSSHARSEELQSELAHWRQPIEASPLPVDLAKNADNTSASAETIAVALDPRETLALLMEAPAAYRTQINEVLAAALAQTLMKWTGSSRVLLDLEGHGREEIFPTVDLTRTVGWFTSIFPVALELADRNDIIKNLREVKEQLRAIPNRGVGYGLLRYLGNAETRAALEQQPQAEVRFNYLGQTDRALAAGSLFKPAEESAGPNQSASTPRGYLLNIIGSVSGGRLRFEWIYSGRIHQRATIEKVAAGFLDELRTLITQARSTETLTPSDFSGGKLSREDLNKVLAKLRR